MGLMICAAVCMLLLAALYGRGQQMPLFFVLAPLAVYVPPLPTFCPYRLFERAERGGYAGGGAADWVIW